ncbi:MAG TPA: 8-oxo-dGTP diphosphatase [bacterium]|nr:8-oxo-dGTP diphosphatase [bacterium]
MPRVDVRTLCFVRDGDRILLQRRRRPPNEGRYNVPGGKVERHEDPYEACLREVREETGLSLSHARLRAVLTVIARDTGTQWLLFTFVAERPAGGAGPITDDEGELRWVPIDEIASLPVVSDIPLILPHLWSAEPGVLMVKIDCATDDADSMLDYRLLMS